MNRARIETCHSCWAEHVVSEDRVPVTKPGQKWVVTDVGTHRSVAVLHNPDCPALPDQSLLRQGTAPTEQE